MFSFTFIVTVYNCEDYLRDCIESILAQTENGYEILLIDDGSTDHSAMICDKYAEKYINIRIIHKKNGGASSARNVGIENITTQYFTFVDCDDLIEKTFLRDIRQIISCNKPDLIVSGLLFDYYNKNRIIRSEEHAVMDWGLVPKQRILKNMITVFEKNLLSSSCAKVYSANLIKTWNFRFNESLNLYEDFEYVIRYLSKCNSVYFSEKSYYHYRIVLSNNRYYSRIEDLNRVNYMIKTIDKSLIELYDDLNQEEQDVFLRQAMNIEFDVLRQIIISTLEVYIFHFKIFWRKVNEIEALSEFGRLYMFRLKCSKILPKELVMVYKKEPIKLWFFVVYKLVRSIFIKTIKGIVGNVCKVIEKIRPLYK